MVDVVKEICEEYDDKGTEREDFMPDIDEGKSISYIDESLKDYAEKLQSTKNDKIQEATDEWEEMLKMKPMKIVFFVSLHNAYSLCIYN